MLDDVCEKVNGLLSSKVENIKVETVYIYSENFEIIINIMLWKIFFYSFTISPNKLVLL